MPSSADQPPTVLLKQAITFLSNGNPGQAIALATQAAQLDDTSPIAWQILGNAYGQLGESVASIDAYKQAATKYIALGDAENARRCVVAIEAIQPPSPQYDPAIAQNFLAKAIVKLDRSDYNNALLDVEWLLQLEPEHPQALGVFALLQAKLGDAPAATVAIARALALAPDDPALQFQRGLVRLALGDGFGAVQEFGALLSQDMTNAALYRQRGQGHTLIQDWDSAFKDLSNAIAIDPAHPESYAIRAAIYQATEDFPAALQDYQQAAALWLNQGNWQNQAKMQAQSTIVQKQIVQQEIQNNNLVCVPIKYSHYGVPVIEVRFNGQYTFDMMLDTGAGRTLISAKMAAIMGVRTTGQSWGIVADGRSVQMGEGWVQSIGVGASKNGVVQDLQVSICDADTDGLLGQNFLRHYDLRIFSTTIEFHVKSSSR
jgi:Tfp pilus assembly protein PilF